MEQISATRTELLTRKAQIQLAQQGADLLRGKREALVREFLKTIREFATTREALREALAEATQALVSALAIDGPEAVAAAAFIRQDEIEVETEVESFWGAKVVNVKRSQSVSTHPEGLKDAHGTSARIDETAERFKAAVDLIVIVAPIDRKLKILVTEIRKTSRRVNALEQRLLPSLSEQVAYIRDTLDQREREDVFRLKRLKQKRPA